LTPDPVSLKDVYDIVSKVDDKLDHFISDTHTHRTKCATEISTLDKRVCLIEDRSARFWGFVVGVAGVVSAGIAFVAEKLWGGT
jgi:hypothetical protein